MQNRRLHLRREALTALTTDELAALAAAGESDPQPTPPVYVTQTLTDSKVVCSGLECYSRGTTCAC